MAQKLSLVFSKVGYDGSSIKMQITERDLSTVPNSVSLACGAHTGHDHVLMIKTLVF